CYWGKGGYGGKPWKVSLCSWSAEARAFRRAARLLRQARLHDASEDGRAEREGLVVEVIARVVHFARALARAVADVEVAARHSLEHEREILRGGDQVRIAIHVLVADDFGADARREIRLLRVVHGRREGHPEIDFGRGAERFRRAFGDAAHA